MARKSSQGSDPALAILYWNSGFYEHRSQLFSPLRPIGVNVVSLHDAVLYGENFEDTDLLEWSRRPGFSIFCSVPLNPLEVVNQFYSFRNFDGDVIPLFDSNQRIAQFDDSSITQIIAKTIPDQGYEQNVGSMMYFSDGAGADMQKWLSTAPLSSINPSTWGIPAPTTTPSIFNRGCWLPKTNFQVGNAILDPNGNVEVVVQVFGAGITGNSEPLWPTTTASTINDGSVQWENCGPLETWLPNQNYPVPVVILDTNGNLQLATAANNNVVDWDNTTTYSVGDFVFFGGNYWTAVASNTGMAPSEYYSTPTWVLSQNPIVTGPQAPVWNTVVGGTTSGDGQYTWTNLGPGQLTESFGTSYVYCYRTIYGHLSTASPISLNTGAIFGPVAAAISSFVISDGVITFQGTNNFIPGNVFTVQGLTSTLGEQLNGQAFSIIAAGTSATQFSAITTMSDGSVAQDSGSTLNLVVSVTGIGSTSPLCNATASITQSSVSANIVTIYANQDGALLSFVPGLWVTLTGMTSGVAQYTNGQQFQIINVDPNGLWFQIFIDILGGIPNQSLTSDSGTATFNAVEIYRTSDGGGIYLFAGAVTNPSGGSVITPYDSGLVLAGLGTDNGIPGIDAWTNPNNVTSDVDYATVALVAPSGGASNFQIVQVCQNIVQQSSTGILTATFPNPVTSGNAIIVSGTVYHAASGIGFSDSQGNTYTPIAEESTANVDGVTTNLVWIATGVASGATTVQLSAPPANSNNFLGFGAFECSGLTGEYQVNGTFGNNGTYQTSGTTLNTGTMTTSADNVALFSFIYSNLSTNSGNTVTPPAGYTASGYNQTIKTPASGQRYQQMSAVFETLSATDTVSPTWSTPANYVGLGLTVAFTLELYSPSNGLVASDYAISVPPDISIAGLSVSLNASFGGAGGSVSVQLMRNGALVGSPKFITPTATAQTYTLGSASDLWGATWSFSDFNAVFGVVMQASIASGGSAGTFSIDDVNVEVFGSTSTTGWVFNDFTTDANLDVLLEAPQNNQNDPPPGAPGSTISQTGTITTYWNGRIWMVVGNYVYFDAGPDCTNGVPEESWPPANRFQFAGPVLALVPTADGLGLLVYLADRVNAILGGPETISFYPTDALSNFGISSPNAIFRDGSIIGQFTTQKQYFEILDKQKEEIGEHIATYLMNNFDPTKTYITMHRNGEDVGVFVSNGTDQVLRFGSNIGAWSVPAFPLGGVGALRSIETSLGVMSLMLASPVAATESQTGITVPGLGSNGGGTDVAWTNPNNITVGSDTSYASVTLTSQTSQVLQASKYPLHIPDDAIVQGVEVSITGKQSASSGGAGALDQEVTSSGTGPTISLGPLTPSQKNEWAVFAGVFQQTDTYFPYFPNGGGGVILSFTISEGVFSATGYNNFTVGQSVIVTGTGHALDGTIFVVATADSSGWTASTTLSSDSGAGISGIASAFGWQNITESAGTYYNASYAGVWAVPLGATTAAIPASEPLVQFVNSSGDAPTTKNWIGALLLFSTDGTAPSVVTSGKIGTATSTSFTFNATSGDTVMVWVFAAGPESDPIISDGQGNVYTIVSNETATISGEGTVQQCVALATVGTTGSLKVSVSQTTTEGWSGMVWEFSHITSNPLTVTPLLAGSGAESEQFSLGTSNTTVTFGSATDLWNMDNWTSPVTVNSTDFGFGIAAIGGTETEYDISEVKVTVFYQASANYLKARDTNSWGDNGQFGKNNGVPYDSAYVTIGSITMTEPGGPLFPLQHVVGYFDAVGNLGTEGNGGPSVPNVWIMPNEISTKAGVGFIQLPEVLQEPPIGQNEPSASLLALRWPVNMFNSSLASQYVHHLQVKIEFEPENAPNTLKQLAFKSEQDV